MTSNVDVPAAGSGMSSSDTVLRHSFKKCMRMSTCSLQINIQIDFQLVKVCTFSSLSFCWRGGATSPAAHLVSLDVDEDVEVPLGGFFVGTDDPVELVMDDAVTNDAVTDDVVPAIAY